MIINNVLVIGGLGQLAQCVKSILDKDTPVDFNFIFLSSVDGDILNSEKLNDLFITHTPTYVINCAAYTAVDKAEDELEKATDINLNGVRLLATCCKIFDATLIHISTDFVFDGTKSFPLKEDDITNPLGVYGQTKLDGEIEIAKLMTSYYIIRTSWLYSEFGNNFVKTMLKLSKDRDQLSVVCDQVGTPTYGIDLAKFLLFVIINNKKDYGLYHYSNEGVASWYDFAHEIFSKDESFKLIPVNSEAYPTRAIRPKFSVLDKSKLKQTFSYSIPHWKESLIQCLAIINK
ncbi:dTDP-4-dehydrorhamnose reductase [uncultured Dokdonia sp.]|uniref:dTDP-4-dehydrorhamnose reductase n=1 Tax=uncultured Dokdonia sp. TaxID=575653 RepID=UPI0030EEE196|tara:strand:+ start:26891 stop:27757 length:867 start_codon:yes stop_codon:yes gene_type:complete